MLLRSSKLPTQHQLAALSTSEPSPAKQPPQRPGLGPAGPFSGSTSTHSTLVLCAQGSKQMQSCPQGERFHLPSRRPYCCCCCENASQASQSTAPQGPPHPLRPAPLRLSLLTAFSSSSEEKTTSPTLPVVPAEFSQQAGGRAPHDSDSDITPLHILTREKALFSCVNPAYRPAPGRRGCRVAPTSPHSPPPLPGRGEAEARARPQAAGPAQPGPGPERTQPSTRFAMVRLLFERSA